jgi:phosphohistidine swiveling domain-containing protein
VIDRPLTKRKGIVKIDKLVPVGVGDQSCGEIDRIRRTTEVGVDDVRGKMWTAEARKIGCPKR